MSHTLIIGCGDTGLRVAARAVAAGERVTALVRSRASAARARRVGALALEWDLDDKPPETALLASADRLIYSAPPPRQGTVDTRMAGVCEALAGHRPATAYISTSGVYGDHGGGWVDEDTPMAPGSDRAQRRVDAETRLREAVPEAVILRAPGIYGPGRLPVDRILAGEPVLDDSAHAWTNRIHIDDLGALVWKAVNERWAHRLYNATDGTPTSRTAYSDTLAELLGTDPPPRIDWAEAEQRFSAMRLSFLSESRRMTNARLLRDTGYRFLFTDYRDGLIASLRGEPAIS